MRHHIFHHNYLYPLPCFISIIFHHILVKVDEISLRTGEYDFLVYLDIGITHLLKTKVEKTPQYINLEYGRYEMINLSEIKWWLITENCVIYKDVAR